MGDWIEKAARGIMDELHSLPTMTDQEDIKIVSKIIARHSPDVDALKAENEKLKDRLCMNKCNSGHTTLPVYLWDCPECHRIEKAGYEKQIAAIDALVEAVREALPFLTLETVTWNYILESDNPEKLCEILGLNIWAINEGLAERNDEIDVCHITANLKTKLAAYLAGKK